MNELLIPEKDLAALVNVQNKLLTSMLAITKKIDPHVASWDKITWGRTSDRLGLRDELEMAHDPRKLAGQVKQM